MKPTQESPFSPSLRRKGLLGLAVMLIGAGLIFGFFLALQTPQQPVASASPRVLGTGATAISLSTPALPTFLPSATAESDAKVTIMRFTATPAGAAPADHDLVAQVNGRPLDRQLLQTMVAADRAMAQLLGQSMPDGRDVLERLINGELVWQAAQVGRFVVAEAQATTALEAILAANQKSRADLEARLAANGLTFDAFMAYLGRLVTVDQFAQSQAQARGQSVAAYVGQLQAQARISFGPAAQMAAETAEGKATATAPMLTPRPPLPSPAATATVRPTPAPSPVAGRGVEVGQLAPDFAVALMQSVTNHPYTQSQTLHWADLLGKPVVLSFWTTWCPYSARQTPVLIEAYRRYARQDIRFVGVAVKEEPAGVEAYVQAKGIPYPIGLDRDGQIAAAYRVSGFPTTYFLDAGGRVAAKHVGQLSAEQIDAYLSSLSPR